MTIANDYMFMFFSRGLQLLDYILTKDLINSSTKEQD